MNATAAAEDDFLVAAERDGPVLAPSGLPAPHGLGGWGGRRLIYRGDADLEALTNCELRVMLLDLRVRAARSRADREGRRLDRRAEVRRAAKTETMAAQKAIDVAARVVAVTDAISAMRKAVPPIEVSFSAVADWLRGEGRGLHRATLYNRPEYASLIWAAIGKPPPDDALLRAAADPEYARVALLTKPELVEEIRRARRDAKQQEGMLASELAKLS